MSILCARSLKLYKTNAFYLPRFVTLKQERGTNTLIAALKKGQLENRLMEFFPLNKRTEENFKNAFVERDLTDIVKLHKAQESQEAKRGLQTVCRQKLLWGGVILNRHMAETKLASLNFGL